MMSLSLPDPPAVTAGVSLAPSLKRKGASTHRRRLRDRLLIARSIRPAMIHCARRILRQRQAHALTRLTTAPTQSKNWQRSSVLGGCSINVPHERGTRICDEEMAVENCRVIVGFPS